MNADEAGYGEHVVVATAVRESARANVAGLAHRGLDVPEYSKAVARALVRAVPFDGTCLLTIDPATLLPTGEVVENGLSAPETVRLTEIELREPDFNKFSALAEAPRGRGQPQRVHGRRPRSQPPPPRAAAPARLRR